jgi:hypothetical protein
MAFLKKSANVVIFSSKNVDFESHIQILKLSTFTELTASIYH